MITLDTGGFPSYKANYMVNWGNASYFQDTNTAYNPYTGPQPSPYQTATYAGAPFTLDKAYGIQNLTDGTSNTLLISEVIIALFSGTSQDHRGDVFNDDYNCAMFMAYTTPNSTIQDQVSGYCVYPYLTNPPCNKNNPPFNAARSYHSGGINAMMADGSVKFVKDSINVASWRALSTSMGNEVISADSY
jgi:prepilin-type processing-associated H-X9-DG protein